VKERLKAKEKIMDETRPVKCVSCEGIYLKSDLSDDGRCSRCVAEDRKPNRKRESY